MTNAPKDLNYFVFKYFCFEHTWWRLFPKRVVCTKFDIYFFLRNCFKNKIYTFFFFFSDLQLCCSRCFGCRYLLPVP